jgi:phosphocarrier protein
LARPEKPEHNEERSTTAKELIVKQVVLVCGAGASSQFIVQRIRSIADLPFSLAAAALDLLPGEPDLIYLGPHLSSAVAELRQRYPAARIAVMSSEEYADHSGELPYRRRLLELGGPDPVASATPPAPAVQAVPEHPVPTDPSIQTENPIMPERTVIVRSAHGLHARPAALFTQAVAATGAAVTIRKSGGDPVDAASILSVLSQGINHGDEVVLAVADGEEAVLDELVRLLETDHDES